MGRCYGPIASVLDHRLEFVLYSLILVGLDR